MMITFERGGVTWTVQRTRRDGSGSLIAVNAVPDDLRAAGWVPVGDLAECRDKALRFDIDQAGVEQRESEAVELVRLRADIRDERAAREKAEALIAELEKRSRVYKERCEQAEDRAAKYASRLAAVVGGGHRGEPEYIVTRKSSLQVGVDEALRVMPPDKRCELVSVVVAGNDVLFFWRRAALPVSETKTKGV